MSVKRQGRPIAVFLESATDLATGRQIMFSWWLNDDILHKTDAVEVVETHDSLVITLDRTGYDLPKTLHATARCTHGILEIRVEKKCLMNHAGLRAQEQCWRVGVHVNLQ